jgi:hypothetical protein
MKMFFLRLIFILTLVFFEYSFFDVLFPWISAPLVIISAVMAWALLINFPHVLFMTIPLTVFFDIVSSGMPGKLTLYAVLLVYGMSFLSRRLLVERRGLGIALYMLFTALGVMGYPIFEFIFSQRNPLFWTIDILIVFFSSLPFLNLFHSLLLSAPLFAVSFFVIRRFEGYMNFVAQGEVLKMR